MTKYEEFIQNILDERPNQKNDDLFMQRHHILPRCKGGDDSEENLIWLTPKEHFIAHKILAEENPNDAQLVAAY